MLVVTVFCLLPLQSEQLSGRMPDSPTYSGAAQAPYSHRPLPDQRCLQIFDLTLDKYTTHLGVKQCEHQAHWEKSCENVSHDKFPVYLHI